MTRNDRALDEAAADLMSAAAVRARCRMVLERGRQDALQHFAVHLDRLPAAAAYVADTIRHNYPSLKVPPHARWRHFTLSGRDLYADAVAKGLFSNDPTERARQRIEFVILSVLLDAGAGPKWRWRQPIATHDGRLITQDVARSEGLALASRGAWAARLFANDREGPYRVDAAALRKLTSTDLGKAFQVTPDNPLDGLDGRVQLLNRLGAAIQARFDLFGAEGRLGRIYDALISCAQVDGVSPSETDTKAIAAPDILALVLDPLGPIWPGRITLDGINLGDTWRHPAIDVPGPTNGLVPFHKLSQWLSYSLIEPLEETGIKVTDLDGLTGLAEYRNGGFFIDAGVLVPRDDTLCATTLMPGDEPIVEWRALTVALLDEIAPMVRTELGVNAQQMPLAAILEGGTWAAGRRIAKERRADGSPPLNIISDGSVF